MLFKTILVVTGMSVGTIAGAAEPMTLGKMCGTLEKGSGSGAALINNTNGDRTSFLLYAPDAGNSAAEVAKAVTRHAGDRVCIENLVQVESTAYPGYFPIHITPFTKIYLEPGYTIRDVMASHCEIFIDKAIPSYDFSCGRGGCSAPLSKHLYIKINRALLDGDVVAVRFYGLNFENPDTFQTNVVQAQKWLGAPDYYEVRPDGMQSSDKNPATFYVETTRGTRYWVNPQGPFSRFTLDTNLFSILAEREGFAGNRDGHTSRPLNVGEFPTTADFAPELNPQGCR